MCAPTKMYMNYMKTKCMMFWPTRLPTIHSSNTHIQYVPTFKYLGITMDPGLTFNEHVEKCIRSANHKLFLLRKVRPLLTPCAAQRIYKAVILPLIKYGYVLYKRKLLQSSFPSAKPGKDSTPGHPKEPSV